MRKGFTLIELLISIAIIGILTTIGFVYFGSYTEAKQLRTDAQALSAKLSEMKTRAFSGQKLNGVLPNCYGVYVNQSDRFVTYADLNANAKYDAGDTLLEELKLQPKISFINLNPDAGVCFKPNLASGQVCDVKNVCGANAGIFFTLRAKSGAQKQVMVIAKTGIVAIDGIDCPGPSMKLNSDGICDWNCGENSVPNKATISCVCAAGYVPAAYPDSQGRFYCQVAEGAM